MFGGSHFQNDVLRSVDVLQGGDTLLQPVLAKARGVPRDLRALGDSWGPGLDEVGVREISEGFC